MSKSFLEVFAGVKLTNAVSGQFGCVRIMTAVVKSIHATNLMTFVMKTFSRVQK